MDNLISQTKIVLSSPELEVIHRSNSNQLISKNEAHETSFFKHSLIYQLQSFLKKNENNKHAINFPEKIIFIIDTVCEFDVSKFKSSNITYESLCMIKRVIEIFLHNKIMLNRKHEFALIILDVHKVHWLCDFTGDLKKLINLLESIKNNHLKLTEKEQFFDLQQVFTLINQYINFKTSLLRNNIIRIIFLYCRSNIIPKIDVKELTVKKLLRNPNLFIDVLYIHEYLNSKNKCEEIYSELTKLDVNNVSYIIEVTRNAIEVHNYMARLLAHPIQRIFQKDIRYFIHTSIKELSQ